MTAGHEHVSVICVFNDPTVLNDCLRKSISTIPPAGITVDLIAVDNTTGRYPSAGAALNRGVRKSTGDVVVMAHQDVFLHSWSAVEAAAAALRHDRGLGVVGATGMDARGRVTGRIRDRVALAGRRVDRPTPVSSVDEVLFMATRARLLEEPISEDSRLAWHAYAVEYCARLRERGLSVVVTDLPLTHNSLTVNLARLDEAHAAVAGLHPASLPLRTTCGTITARSPSSIGRRPVLADHRWLYRWLRSQPARRTARRAAGGCPTVLDDIGFTIDDVLARLDGPLDVFNLDRDGGFPADEVVTLHRRDREIRFLAGSVEDAARLLEQSPTSPLVVTNLDREALSRLQLPGRSAAGRLVGVGPVFGWWLLSGFPREALPAGRGRVPVRPARTSRPS